MEPAVVIEPMTGGLRKRGSLALPDLKLKSPNYGLNDLQFVSPLRSQIERIVQGIRRKFNAIIGFFHKTLLLVQVLLAGGTVRYVESLGRPLY